MAKNPIQIGPPSKTANSLRRRILIAVISLVTILLFVAIVVAAIAIRTALIAEENLQAFFHAHRATMEFVQQNDGRWPRSWDDLRSVRPESDFDWVAEHLDFDFEADPRDIVSQTPETFSAIQPHQPCYVLDDRIQLLIETLKSYHAPH